MDELLKRVMDDNSSLFKQALAILNELEEAKELLREWKELAWRAMPINRTSTNDLEKKRELDERTDRFLGNEGKNE